MKFKGETIGFSADIEAWIEKAGLETDKAIRALRLDMVQKVIKIMPVDTGQARGSLIARIGSPGNSPKKIKDKTGAKALSKAMAAINAPSANIFYFTSNIPYIGKLENGGYSQGKYSTKKTTASGYSSQAPYGMFKISALQLRQGLKDFTK